MVQPQGIKQSDVPKIKGFIAKGISAEDIVNKVMLGYKPPIDTVKSFFPDFEKPEAAPKKAPSHPQDRAAADRKEADLTKRLANARAAYDEAPTGAKKGMVTRYENQLKEAQA